MEENNFELNEVQVDNNEVVENNAPVVEEVVVEAPVAETHTQEIAQENNIQASIAEVLEPVSAITTNSFAQSTVDVPALGAVANGVIGVTQVQRPSSNPTANKSANAEKVAVYSTKNISVPGLGKVYRGYNIVNKDAADQWVTNSYIRLATPDEVAKEFGK